MGIIACILFFIAGIILGISGSELGGLRSVSGTSIAEAYYQEMGRFGQAYSLMSFAFGLLSLGLSIGIGNYLKLKGKSNISFQGLPDDQTGMGIQGKTEKIDSPVNKEDFDGVSLTSQEKKSSPKETNLSKDYLKQKKLSGIGLIALSLGVILIIAGRSGIEKEFNYTLEERVAFEKEVLENKTLIKEVNNEKHLFSSKSKTIF